MSGFDAVFESRDNEFGALGAQTLLDAAHGPTSHWWLPILARRSTKATAI